MVLAYSSYAKENLLTITLKIEQKDRFTRYEMEAIGEDIKQMVWLCNNTLWQQNKKID